jgi:hypothetical protein
MKRLIAATIILLFISINAWSFIFNSQEGDKSKEMIKTQLNSAFKSYQIISHEVEIYNKKTKKAPDENKFKLDMKGNNSLSKATNGPMGDVIIKFSKDANPSLKNKTIRVIPKEKEKEVGRQEDIIYDYDKTITLTNMSLNVSGFSFEKESRNYSISPQISASDFGPSFTVNDPEDLTDDTYKEAQQEIIQAQKEQEATQNQDNNSNKNNNGNGSNNSSSSDGPTSTSSSLGAGKAPKS